MPTPPTSIIRSGRRLHIRSHEIVVHTSRVSEALHLCFVFVADPFAERHELKVFRGKGPSAEEAEAATIKKTLSYLDHPVGKSASTILAGRNTLHVAGRKVDIFCDHLPDGSYQAFPFLYRPDGSRVLILQFHMNEAIVGDTPAKAISLCIERLDDYFLSRNGTAGIDRSVA